MMQCIITYSCLIQFPELDLSDDEGLPPFKGFTWKEAEEARLGKIELKRILRKVRRGLKSGKMTVEEAMELFPIGVGECCTGPREGNGDGSRGMNCCSWQMKAHAIALYMSQRFRFWITSNLLYSCNIASNLVNNIEQFSFYCFY